MMRSFGERDREDSNMPKRKANSTAKAATKKANSGRTSAKASAKSNGNGAAKKAARGAATGKKAAAKKKAVPVPPQYGTATPHLIVSPCGEALDFYAKAFGAKVLMTMPGPEGRIMHAEMKIGDSIVMCSDEMDMPGSPNRKTPKNAGATTGGVMLYLKDVDSFFEKAVAAGATAVMPPTDQFWGDRYGQIEDPYGHVWALATHVRDMTPKAMKREMEKMFAQQGAAEA
jgi:PhnB protein